MSKVLKSGTRGEPITALQQELTKLGFEMQPDGVFGPSTTGAVEELQALFGYDIDGMVGDDTHQLIAQQIELGFDVRKAGSVRDALAASGGVTSLNRILRPGSEGADVRFLQRRLATLGSPIKVDGKFGPATELAVRSLQKAFGYDIDGSAGEATHKLLNQQIGYAWDQRKAAQSAQQSAHHTKLRT